MRCELDVMIGSERVLLLDISVGKSKLILAICPFVADKSNKRNGRLMRLFIAIAFIGDSLCFDFM